MNTDLVCNFILLCIIFLFILWSDDYFVNLSGKDGVIGLQGINGSQGEQGMQGQPGIVNFNDKIIYSNISFGIIGDMGNNGERGPKGSIGPNGLIGKKGLMGKQGNDGPQGQIGHQGIQGPQGAKGNDAKWHFSLVDKNNCIEGIYDEETEQSSCPDNKIMVGIENYYGVYKLKCCSIINDDEQQKIKYDLIKNGKSVNPLNIYEY